MTRWISVLLLVFSIMGAAAWHAPIAAQSAPTAGAVQPFSVEGGHAIGLSPDGSMYAVAVPRTALCVYDTETQQALSCGSLEALDAGIRIEDVVWSPDSSRLAFGEEGFRYGSDGDLWVMDAASGELINLTDDGYDGNLLTLGNDGEEEPTYSLDVAPAWTPDGQFITFSRSPIVNGERAGNELAQVPAEGGEVEILATIPNAESGAVYFGTGWDPSGETFYFSLTHLDNDNPENGIWAYDAASAEIAPLALGVDPELGPLTLLQVSPAGNQLLAWYPMAAGQLVTAEPILRLVDTATSTLSAPQMRAPEGVSFVRTMAATFSPDGQALLMVASLGSGQHQVWVSDLAGGEPQLLIEEIEDAFLDLGVMPSWGANGTVLLGHGIGGGYLFTIDGIGLSALPSVVTPPANLSAVASPDGASFAVGSDVQAVGIAPLFAAPDPSAAVVLVLTPGSAARILGAPVDNEFGRWYPVLEPATQTIGYAQADRLGIAS